jgi:hypothetical protein
MRTRTPESDTTKMRGTVARMENTQAVIDGNTFYAYKIKGHSDTLADDASIQILLTTPENADIGVGVQALSEGNSELTVYEGATSVTGGTLFVPRNRNRASTITSNSGVLINPTTATGTTVVYESLVIGGTGGHAAGAASSSDYAICKRNTSYLFVLTNRSGQANIAQLSVIWVE